MSQDKVVKIEITYQSGKVMGAEGDDADAIWRAIDSACMMDAIHGAKYEGPQLKVLVEEREREQ